MVDIRARVSLKVGKDSDIPSELLSFNGKRQANVMRECVGFFGLLHQNTRTIEQCNQVVVIGSTQQAAHCMVY